MPTRAIFPLRFRAVCAGCRGQMQPGQQARRVITGSLPHLYFCMECAPVTSVAPAAAEGAVDSSKAQLKAKGGRGRALKTGVPATASKRRRKPQRERLAARAVQEKRDQQ